MALISLPLTIGYVRYSAWGQPTSPIPPMPEGSSVVRWRILRNDLIVSAAMEAFSKNIWRAFLRNTTTSAQITALSQQLLSEPLVTLFELDLSKYGLGIGRFTTEVTENGQALRWNGNRYYPAQVQAEGFTKKSSGPNDRPTLRLANTSSLISSLVYEGNDLVGCLLRRIRTFRRFLDDGADPNPEATWPIEEYIIDRKRGQDKFQVEFELTTPLDQEGVYLPKRQVLRDYCSFIYRFFDPASQQDNGQIDMDKAWIIDRFDPCPYAEERYYTAKGQPTTKISEDRCGKYLRDCELRFGAGNPLPFRGFPGVARTR